MPFIETKKYPQANVGNQLQVDYWTGFYSTRPALKQLIKDVWKLQRSIEVFIATLQIWDSEYHIEKKLEEIAFEMQNAKERAMILLHHDAITGTHMLATKEDYESKAFAAYKKFAMSGEKLFKLIA
jgi:hypothetical protein